MAQSNYHPRPDSVLSRGLVLSVQHEGKRMVKFVVAYNYEIYMCRHMHFGEEQDSAIVCKKSQSYTGENIEEITGD